MVGLGGLEPPTSRLSSARSNQLSYKPEPWTREQCSPGSVTGLVREERETKTAVSRSIGLTGRVVPSVPIEEFAFSWRNILRKEVIQPQVPLRLPCYDFTPVADPTVVACPLAVSETPSGKTNSHGVTGGVYKARERIHRSVLIYDY